MTKSILIADDDPVVQSILSAMLSGQGYALTVVNTGEQCIEEIRLAVKTKRLPLLLFLDFMLPDMNGGEVLRELKTISGDTIPVVLLSANEATELRELQLTIEPDAFLKKPFTKDELMETLQSVIAR